MRNRYITLIIALLLLPMAVGAQALKTSYFLDNSLQRMRLNPAFAPRANYLSLPVMSNTGVGVYCNLGPADFLYPKNGELLTFLNSNVSVEEFSKNLPKKPGMDFEVETDILSFGFYTKRKSFWSVDLGLRVDGRLGIARDFFMLAKKGMATSTQTYSMKGFDIFQTSSAYAALGYSRDMSDVLKGLRVGLKFRAFLPVDHVGMTLGNTSLTLDKDRWAIHTEASGVMATSFLKVHPDALFDKENAPDLMETDMSQIAPAGFGAAIDLGAEWEMQLGTVVDGLTFSFAALDLGAYKFNEENIQRFASKGDVAYAGLNDIEISEGLDVSESVDALVDDFETLANLEEVASKGGHTISTGPKIFAGVEYPFLKKTMSVGLLYSAKFGYSRVMNELTVAYNLSPLKFFNLGVSYSFLNTTKTLGWMLEISPRGGFDIFVGSDYTFWEVMPAALPVIPVDKFFVNARFGVSLMLGSRHTKPEKKKKSKN